MNITQISSSTMQAEAITLQQAATSSGIVWLDIYPHDAGWEVEVEGLLGFSPPTPCHPDADQPRLASPAG
ncbi:MAG: hypothetical protein L3K52_06765 [Candidatus Thiothrix sulfatifontis]|nr:MAG: hypothetical protein L3K52_06765 [Candidatus Thiothrix sulfatifontis]